MERASLPADQGIYWPTLSSSPMHGSGLGVLAGSIDASGLKPPFAALAGAGKFRIFAHGTSYRVNIRFAPRAAGSFSGTITITSNDPNNPSATVTVRGSGE